MESITSRGKYNFLISLGLFFGVAIIYSFPLFHNFFYLGVMDWDQFTFWNAVFREEILKYHQFPLWNPYSNGGNVLLAHPHSSFLSPLFIFVLFFGPLVGLKLEIIIHLLIGMYGMFLFSKYLKLEKYSSYLPSFIYMLSSIYTLHISEGHAEWLVMAFVPYIFLFYLKSLKDYRYIIGGIISFSLMILGGSVDVFNITLIMISCYSILITLQRRRIGPLKVILFIFAGTFLLCSIKLIPMLEFFKENPRKVESFEKTEVSLLPFILTFREQNTFYKVSKGKLDTYGQKVKFVADKIEHCWHEYGAYIGTASLILAIFGLFFYFKQHWPFFISGILCLWISLGGGAFYNVWGLLHKLPIYNSLRVPSRFILGFIFTVSLFSGFGLSKLESLNKRKYYKFFIIFLMGYISFDLISVDHSLLRDVFTIKPIKVERYSEFKQRYHSLDSSKDIGFVSMRQTLLNNSGVREFYEVVNVRNGDVGIVGEKDYKGEVYLLDAKKEVKIVKFSPNSIKLEVNINNPDTIIINQNFYKGWKIRGAKGQVIPYKGLIAARVPKGNYNIEFYYFPISFLIGSFLSISMIIILFLYRKLS